VGPVDLLLGDLVVVAEWIAVDVGVVSNVNGTVVVKSDDAASTPGSDAPSHPT
jgi:hypothetical protein